MAAQYKGTGPVNIGDWTAPMKSRGGKPVQKFARGGSAFVNPDKYPGWPQMAGTSGPYRRGEVISSDEAAATGNPDERPVHFKPGFYE